MAIMRQKKMLRARPMGKRRATGPKPQQIDQVWKKEMARNMPDGQKGMKRALAGRRVRRVNRLSTRRKLRPTNALVEGAAGLGRSAGISRNMGLSHSGKLQLPNR